MKKFILSIFVASFALTSCSDFFNATGNDTLTNDDNFTSAGNVYATYVGLLGTIRDVAAKSIVINDLRSDVLTPTSGAPAEYWEIFNFQATTGNELVDPTDYYKVVMSANDFLIKTREFNESYPGYLNSVYYKQLIASGITTRAWAYLQIGKIYGEAAYYDYAMTSDQVDLSTIPVLSFDELIDELLYFMQTGIDGITGISRLDIPEMFSDAESELAEYWRTSCISCDALMMELYLWRGDYTNAIIQGIKIIHGEGVYVFSNLYRYKLTSNTSYYGMGDWDRLFHTTIHAGIINESLTQVFFNTATNEENEIHYLCSSTYPNVYYMKPTTRLVELFTESARYGLADDVLESLIPYDYRAEDITYGVEMGDTVLMKYHNNSRSSYDRDATIYLYRASEIHLMIAEALVSMNNLDAASIFLNEGFNSYYTSDDTNPFESPIDAPVYDRPYLQNGKGVRGRVNAPKIDYLDYDFYEGVVDTADVVAYEERQAYVLDSLISVETALELAGEGKRWFTLMRMARNMGNPEFLIDQVVQKFSAEEQMRYRVLLSNTDNWFIKYDLGLPSEDEE